KMRTQILTLLNILIYGLVFSQEIEIIEKADSIPNIKEKGLAFISDKTDLKDYYFIAKIKVKANDFNQILSGLQRKAIDFNANAFKYIGKVITNKETSVSFDLYSALPELIEKSRDNLEKNIIYFFGNDKKTQKFKIDKQKIELKPNDIYRYEIPKKKEVKINKGGFTGMTVFHYWKENQPVTFYAFGSGNITGYGDGWSSIGLSINTGNIIELRNDFAYLLMELKK
uniref:hypothetical protein n=1 Tax=uncultured Algibacter sp. TaxID=298659 RepID=UPI00260C49F9